MLIYSLYTLLCPLTINTHLAAISGAGREELLDALLNAASGHLGNDSRNIQHFRYAKFDTLTSVYFVFATSLSREARLATISARNIKPLISLMDHQHGDGSHGTEDGILRDGDGQRNTQNYK